MRRAGAAIAAFAGFALWLSGAAAQASDATGGRWAASVEACSGWFGTTPADTPLIVTGSSLRWHDGPCRVGRMYKTGKAVHIEAHCWRDATGRSTPVRLEASGNRLRATWNRGPVTELMRCR